MNASKAQDWLRILFAQIDKMIYWLISVTYSIIMQLKDISIFGEGDIKEFASRIYVFLGIIMLFKVTFSLITYLVDPDTSRDKTKGTGNLIKNVLITLILIVLVPYGFDLLYNAQSAIIDDNLIPRLILGTKEEPNNLTLMMDSDTCKGESASVANYGDYLALATLRPFVHVYEDSDTSKEDLLASLDDSTRNTYCYSGKASTVLSKSVLYADTAILNTGEYIFEYNYFISTAFGIVVFLLLLNFCFDIAVRTIKLGFLEIMAPIPIISYIDPKSGKDGQFKKWLKEVFNTWLSLFLRLGVIYFAIYIITMINKNVQQIHQENGNIVMLFLIIGALMFAKQAVPLIENIFGIKIGHTVQLNPFKKISEQALGGKAVLGLGAAGAGIITGAAGQTASNVMSFARSRQNLKRAMSKLDENKPEDKEKYDKLRNRLDHLNFTRLATTTAGGLAGGAVRGMTSGYKSGSSGKMNVLKNVKDDVQSGNRIRNNRENINTYNRELKDKLNSGNITSKDYKEQKYGFFERNVTERVDKYAGVKNEYGGYGYYNKQIEDLNRKISDNDSAENAIRTGLANYCTSHGLDQSLIEELRKTAKQYSTDIEHAISALDENRKQQFLDKYGMSDLDNKQIMSKLSEISTHYNTNLKASYDNLDRINADTKQMKAERKNFKEMLDARENAKNNK